MFITKPGRKIETVGEFRFACKRCGCEWNADRGDNGLHISPPCCEFYAYMNCPNCGKETDSRNDSASVRYGPKEYMFYDQYSGNIRL